MKKRELIWVVATLVVAALAWIIYSTFIEEKVVEPGAAPAIDLIDEPEDVAGADESAEMDFSEFSSVGDEEE